MAAQLRRLDVRQVCQEFDDFGRHPFPRVFLAVKIDVLFNPVDVGVLSAIPTVGCANEILNLFEQSWHDEAPL